MRTEMEDVCSAFMKTGLSLTEVPIRLVFRSWNNNQTS